MWPFKYHRHSYVEVNREFLSSRAWIPYRRPGGSLRSDSMGLSVAPYQTYRIPLHAPYSTGAELAYVQEALQAGQWASGPFVQRLERLLAEKTGFNDTAAVSSGTAALTLALTLSGVRPGTEVVVPALTFAATANAVFQAGAWPLIIDVEDRFWQIDMAKLTSFLERGRWQRRERKLVNPDTKRVISAVLSVDLMGHMANDGNLAYFAGRYDLPYIEDRAESLGSKHISPFLGLSPRAACWSFNGNKVVASPGGGAIGAKAAFLEHVRVLRDQGKDPRDQGGHQLVGGNYRMSNVAAGIALGQLEALDDILERKRKVAERYATVFTGVDGVEPMGCAPWCQPNWWLYTVLVPKEMMQTALSAFADKGIEVRRMFRPLNQLKAFAACPAYSIEVAPIIYERALSLPSGAGLKPEEQEEVADVLKKALNT